MADVTPCPTCGGSRKVPWAAGHYRPCPDCAKETKARWRVGRKVPIHLYEQLGDEPSDEDPPVGTMLTPEFARRAVEGRNAVALLDAARERHAQLREAVSGDTRANQFEHIQELKAALDAERRENERLKAKYDELHETRMLEACDECDDRREAAEARCRELENGMREAFNGVPWVIGLLRLRAEEQHDAELAEWGERLRQFCKDFRAALEPDRG